MIHTNTWSPDTCGCRLTYTWDDAVDTTQRLHTCVAVEACVAHSELPLGVGQVRSANQPHTSSEGGHVWGAVHEENQRKNRALAYLLSHPNMQTQVVQGKNQNGEPVRSWAVGNGPVFRYDEHRVLCLNMIETFSSVLQGDIDTEFGAGLVRLV